MRCPNLLSHWLRVFVRLCAILIPTIAAYAADPPSFKSQLFEKGTLVYSDDFDAEYDRERWGTPKKDRQIKDGKLIVRYEAR